MTIKLSICIPTYNFGKFIGQTLDSIVPQLSTEVELIVLDGGSTDETAKVVAIRQLDCEQLTYVHQGFRGGIDRDIETVITLSRGKYCWLFSADDIMLPGAIDKVLDAIKSNDDVYICEHVLCNLEMEPICEYPPFNNINHSMLFNLDSILQRKNYFRLARTSEAFFSFMSGPIFKREVWDGVKVPESFRDTCWIVAGHLLSMIPKGMTVNYLGEKLLHKRGGNDSFSDRGVVNRCRIAIEAFQHVGNTIFGRDSEEAYHIRRVLQLDIPLLNLMVAKYQAAKNPSTEDIKVLNRIVKMHYADPSVGNWIKFALYKMLPLVVLNVASQLKGLLRKCNGK
jgi:abequosyltransferase